VVGRTNIFSWWDILGHSGTFQAERERRVQFFVPQQAVHAATPPTISPVIRAAGLS
jgi:hypothetical protein